MKDQWKASTKNDDALRGTTNDSKFGLSEGYDCRCVEFVDYNFIFWRTFLILIPYNL